MAFYLDPVRRDSGCLRVIPGSHKADSVWRAGGLDPRAAEELWGVSPPDGLVVSTSQIGANDLYRCTIAPRRHAHWDEGRVDAMTLRIGRIGTVVVMLLCTGMAWVLIERNVALLIWVGVGGMMAALSGPLILGALWSGVTRAGALAGLFGGGDYFRRVTVPPAELEA